MQGRGGGGGWTRASGPRGTVASVAPGESAGRAMPVSTLTAMARDVLEGGFPALWVAGEVSNFQRHRNGHWYFTLKDAAAAIDCVVWGSDQARLPAPPDDGMQVAAFGRLTMWAKRARVQFVVHAMEAEGEGLWRKAFEKVRAALDADGLLDPARKRPIPRFPRVVGVVTSADGAAMHDIVSVIARRHPGIDVVIIPAAVQGETAPASLVRALRRAARWGGADVLVIARGGGSREDLWAFNDEKVARAIAACPVPTVSAVGHVVDVTIADYVADARAATPSAAAELVAPVRDDLRRDLAALAGGMSASLTRRVRDGRRDLLRTARAVRGLATHTAERGRERVRTLSAKIHALSPLATLARGYALPRDAQGRALSRVAQYTAGLPFELVLRDGQVAATTDAVRPGAAP
ncbi:MAG TPA: exodeoxyribonuclease VII large subunit [Gemmatimonadaceae bacterium]|nr:exodeoxyribonuclease VII large subunit [Gemmatimonadaceae bacterium]